MTEKRQTLTIMKLTGEAVWTLGWLAIALGGFGAALGITILAPVWLIDMLTLATMRPPVMVWAREILRLQYSLAEVWAALPLYWPALWDHIAFSWAVMGILVLWAVGVGLLLLPVFLVFSPVQKQQKGSQS